jgi:hypothetical protein
LPNAPAGHDEGRPRLIHRLWLLPSSWAGVFEEAGYAAVTPVWPDDPGAVEAERANPHVFAKKTLAQIADRGLSAATAIANASYKKQSRNAESVTEIVKSRTAATR